MDGVPAGVRRLLAAVRATVESGRRRIGAALRRQEQIDELLTGDLGFFEATFLTMQRKIFEDQAPMHEAYLGEGLNGIRALRDAGIIDIATEDAWAQIDQRDRAPVHAGNRILLYREQHDIIDRFYVDMGRHSPPSGRVFTYLLTLAGTPAVPGAKTYCDVFPLTLALPTWRDGRLAVRTPFPAGNLASFPNRWQLIDDDTLPAYQRLIDDVHTEAATLIEQPVAQRATRFRLVRRGGSVAFALATHWRLAYMRGAPPPPIKDGRLVEIDLRTPPTRKIAGLAPTEDSRAWADPHRRPFPLTVSLPGDRVF